MPTSSTSLGVNGTFSDALAQCFAVDKLSGDELFGVDLVDFVDGENVWVVERRRCFGLLHKSSHAIAGLIVDHVRRQNFQCDFAIEFGVVGEVNLTHATRTELGADFVAANLFARGERQRSIRGSLLGSNEAAAIVISLPLRR